MSERPPESPSAAHTAEQFPSSVTGAGSTGAVKSKPSKRESKPAKVLNRLVTFWKDWLEPFAFAMLITQFIVTMVLVDGVSMMPNLRDGERVLVPKYELWLHRLGIGDFKRGDIVVFKPPRAAAAISPTVRRDFYGLWEYRPHLIKRIIGVGGDTIRIEGGEVWVNNQKLDSSFTTAYWAEQGCWDTTGPLANQVSSSMEGILPDSLEITVPEGHYFVMGDNRTPQGSEDSRLFGTVPLSDMAGRAVAVLWPIMQPQKLSYDCESATTSPAGEGSRSGLRMLNDPAAFDDLNFPRP